MIRTLVAACALAAAPAAAQTAPAASSAPMAPQVPVPVPAPAPAPATVDVRITTSLGTIVVALEKTRAPLTTANFLRYVDGKRLDGTSFYRAMKGNAEFGLIQGGIDGDPKRALPPIALEPTSRTGLHHGDGTISLARYALNSGRADFFITVGDMPALDAQAPGQAPARGDTAGYAAFGHVVEGMDVVRAIMGAATSPTRGTGAMKGQMIAAPVRILSVRRVVERPR